MASQNKKSSAGKWIDDLFAGVGKYVTLETGSGTIREGKMTGLRTRTVMFNNEPSELVTDIELNGDPTDTVGFADLVKIAIV